MSEVYDAFDENLAALASQIKTAEEHLSKHPGRTDGLIVPLSDEDNELVNAYYLAVDDASPTDRHFIGFTDGGVIGDFIACGEDPEIHCVSSENGIADLHPSEIIVFSRYVPRMIVQALAQRDSMTEEAAKRAGDIQKAIALAERNR